MKTYVVTPVCFNDFKRDCKKIEFRSFSVFTDLYCSDTPPTQFCRSRDDKLNMSMDQNKTYSMSFLCCNLNDKTPQYMFILSMNAEIG